MIRQSIYTSRQAPNVLFMPSVFNEAMELLSNAHEYFALFAEGDKLHFSEELKGIYDEEMSRITLRLSSIMAWIMVQRSVFSGKIPPSEAALCYGLDFQDICRVDNSVLHGVMPSHMCYLLDRSFELYERVLRLDDQVKLIH